MIATTARLVTLGLIIFNVALVSTAQLLLKLGAASASGILDKKHLIASGLKFVFTPYMFFGTACYVISLVLWIYILTRAQLSLAYPLMSLSYVVVMVFSVVFVNEAINLSQWGGALFIVVGTSVIFLFK